MLISDWSSDVCSSDLDRAGDGSDHDDADDPGDGDGLAAPEAPGTKASKHQIPPAIVCGLAAGRRIWATRLCQYDARVAWIPSGMSLSVTNVMSGSPPVRRSRGAGTGWDRARRARRRGARKGGVGGKG